MFLWCVRDGWRDIYTPREDFFFPYLLPGARGEKRLHPLVSRRQRPSNASDRLRIVRSTAFLCILSKSDRVVLIMGSPSGYTPVVLDCPDQVIISLFTHYSVTAFQSTRGH